MIITVVTGFVVDDTRVELTGSQGLCMRNIYNRNDRLDELKKKREDVKSPTQNSRKSKQSRSTEMAARNAPWRALNTSGTRLAAKDQWYGIFGGVHYNETEQTRELIARQRNHRRNNSALYNNSNIKSRL